MSSPAPETRRHELSREPLRPIVPVSTALSSRWTSVGAAAAAFIAAAIAAAALAGGVSPTAGASGARTSVCGARIGSPVKVSHVIWIWFENHAFDRLIGAADAPVIGSLATRCGLAVDYHALAHPSLPNYIAATSGGTQGIHDDRPPVDHPLPVASLFEQAASAGSYEESMPSSCDLQAAGRYWPRHNPETYYTRIRSACRSGDLPLGTTKHGAFAEALDRSRLPAFSFVTPNACDDMHTCAVSVGDAWLGRWIARITSSASYRAGTTVVFVTWDEDDGSSGNRVPLIVVSPYTRPGARSAAALTHYSLLRTTEELLGLRTFLGHAARATDMRPLFGL